MDTSDEYVKMCKKLSFQDTYKIGDYFYSYDKKRVQILTDFEQTIGDIVPTKIYRQDQLQELIPALPTTMNCENLSEFMKQTRDYDTWEQLWLAFVMKTKFSKSWNGEEWV